jgi:cold shock CspA family protein
MVQGTITDYDSESGRGVIRMTYGNEVSFTQQDVEPTSASKLERGGRVEFNLVQTGPTGVFRAKNIRKKVDL